MAWLEIAPENLYLSEQVIVLLSCALSFLGSALIIFTHIRWPELRSRPRQLLLFLSVADLLSAVSYFYGVLRDFKASTWDCVAQGALSTFSNTSSFFWTMAVALYLYITIVHSQQSLAEHMIYWFHVISWGVPLVITVTAVCLQKIGYDASYVSVGWCWIDIAADDRLTWMLLAGKVWEILAYLVLPFLYIHIKKHIGRAHRALSEYRPILSAAPVYQPKTIADKKLVFIPVIFIFLRIWSTIRFILTLCDSPAVHNPILVVLHGIGNSFQGGANCIMFVLCTRVIRTRLLKSLCWCCYGSPGSGDVRGGPVSESYPSGYGSTSGILDSQEWSPHQPST
ncbi:PREDICTED: probable G-protein coupled receptor 157 [Nanorana parkeri]|uniref:probable G-protein coupled receptor 157 n=1 Tax=Nanorana parkeri TaxID=125878 RepID=UPI000854B529|nr:PREDICTED: probable G-protein coupled receptor 157 [Nanorana parkeri]